jgi:primosomal protein N' (replication factor Y)
VARVSAAPLTTPDLGLVDPVDGAGRRFVEVAVDAAGGGGSRTYTYHVPRALAGLEPGEAVLVEYGRRQALAVVLGAAPEPPVATKPVLDRVRADGPLLPPTTLALARWIASTYLAPPAIVLRAMLPPGFLERLELMAELLPETGEAAAVAGAADAADDVLAQLAQGPRRVRDLRTDEGRAALLRRLRALRAEGRVALDWTLVGSGVGPRYDRWAHVTEEGRAWIAGHRTGRPLGPRQTEALAALSAAAAEPGGAGLVAARVAELHGASALPGLVRRGLAEVEVRQRERDPLGARPAGLRGGRPAGAPLLPAQAEAVAAVRRAIATRDPTPLLVDGVTGGGRTTVYVESIAASLEAGRPALVLVPEIALATPLVDRLRADLQATVALVHSGLSDGERLDTWRRIREGRVDVVVGTRLAVLAPLAEPGVVVVDEEHESAYKSDRTPRLQARDAAVALGRIAGAAVVLGSATPAVESDGRARSGEYRHVRLPSRAAGELPEVTLVDLRAELAAGNRSFLSEELASALAALDTANGARAILLINRRGSASVVMCRDCGHVQECPDCGRPLVFHQAGGTLRCHHCGRAAPAATRCPSCSSPRIRYLGGGTERVEREVRERFPRLRVGRLDRDVVERRDAATRVLDAFASGRMDVLVGTSLVAKSIDVPEVTLVGIVSADVALNLPDERAAERTYQLLAQAIGRAGRGTQRGRAIVQTYQPDHPAIRAVVEGDRDSFYARELDLRRRFRAPPFARLVKLTIADEDAEAAESAARAMAERLTARAAERGSDVAVVGPAPAYVARRAGRWRWNILLRGGDPVGLLDGGLDPPWSVDVDPESTL